MNSQSGQEMIDFVQKTTEAITVISQATKSLEQTTGALKEMISTQNTTNAKSFEEINGKMDGLLTMFKYVIAPLVAGILALVGIKTILKI
jgi:hypothetical protein